MPQAKELSPDGVHVNVRIDPEASRMLDEMLRTWYPGMTRVKGAVVSRAVRQLYKQFQKEMKSQ